MDWHVEPAILFGKLLAVLLGSHISTETFHDRCFSKTPLQMGEGMFEINAVAILTPKLLIAFAHIDPLVHLKALTSVLRHFSAVPPPV